MITFWLGFTGGADRSHKGAAVEPLCLPRNPGWGMYIDGYDGYKTYVYGVEYETSTFKGNIKNVHNHDIPCALCLVYDPLFRCFLVSMKYEIKCDS